MADNARQKSKKYKMISNGNARKRQSRPKNKERKGNKRKRITDNAANFCIFAMIPIFPCHCLNVH